MQIRYSIFELNKTVSRNSLMCIWSILLIKSELKWCIHLGKSRFLYFNYLVSVTAGGQEISKGTYSQVLRSTSVDSKLLESIKIVCVKIDLNCNFVCLLHTPFGFSFFRQFLGITFQLLRHIPLAKD